MAEPRSRELPLSGTTVLDCSRLLPGAVLARMLLDLGARLIKVEDPAGGDPMRHAPPLVEGVGAGFSFFLAGAQSVCLDLSNVRGAASFRQLSRHADVVIESFRPGTMGRWGLGSDRLRAANPALTVCALSSFGSSGPWADRVAHDLNLTATSGLLDLVEPSNGVPGIQIADVTTAMLGCSAVLGALLQRFRTGRGAVIDQPLSSGVVPLLAWAWADALAGSWSLRGTVLAGRAPAYRTYPCQDGAEIALGALEPKFWLGFIEMLGLSELAHAGLDTGDPGRRAADEVRRVLATKPRDHWVAEAVARGLPVSKVQTLDDALKGGFFDTVGLADRTTSDPRAGLPGPFVPSLAPRALGRAPTLGEHTRAILTEHGIEVDVDAGRGGTAV